MVAALVSPLRLYGDESELQFWTVAAHYLHSFSPMGAPAGKEAAPRDRVHDPLDICYDILCENAYFQVPASHVQPRRPRPGPFVSACVRPGGAGAQLRPTWRR